MVRPSVSVRRYTLNRFQTSSRNKKKWFDHNFSQPWWSTTVAANTEGNRSSITKKSENVAGNAHEGFVVRNNLHQQRNVPMHAPSTSAVTLETEAIKDAFSKRIDALNALVRDRERIPAEDPVLEFVSLHDEYIQLGNKTDSLDLFIQLDPETVAYLINIAHQNSMAEVFQLLERQLLRLVLSDSYAKDLSIIELELCGLGVLMDLHGLELSPMVWNRFLELLDIYSKVVGRPLFINNVALHALSALSHDSTSDLPSPSIIMALFSFIFNSEKAKQGAYIFAKGYEIALRVLDKLISADIPSMNYNHSKQRRQKLYSFEDSYHLLALELFVTYIHPQIHSKWPTRYLPDLSQDIQRNPGLVIDPLKRAISLTASTWRMHFLALELLRSITLHRDSEKRVPGSSSKVQENEVVLVKRILFSAMQTQQRSLLQEIANFISSKRKEPLWIQLFRETDRLFSRFTKACELSGSITIAAELFASLGGGRVAQEQLVSLLHVTAETAYPSRTSTNSWKLAQNKSLSSFKNDADKSIREIEDSYISHSSARIRRARVIFEQICEALGIHELRKPRDFQLTGSSHNLNAAHLPRVLEALSLCGPSQKYRCRFIMQVMKQRRISRMDSSDVAYFQFDDKILRLMVTWYRDHKIFCEEMISEYIEARRRENYLVNPLDVEGEDDGTVLCSDSSFVKEYALSHHDHSALAYAYFTVSDLDRGFMMFRQMLSAGIIPNNKDISQCLRIWFINDPNQAIEFLMKLVEYGFKPTRTFIGDLISVVHEELHDMESSYKVEESLTEEQRLKHSRLLSTIQKLKEFSTQFEAKWDYESMKLAILNSVGIQSEHVLVRDMIKLENTYGPVSASLVTKLLDSAIEKGRISVISRLLRFSSRRSLAMDISKLHKILQVCKENAVDDHWQGRKVVGILIRQPYWTDDLQTLKLLYELCFKLNIPDFATVISLKIVPIVLDSISSEPITRSRHILWQIFYRVKRWLQEIDRNDIWMSQEFEELRRILGET